MANDTKSPAEVREELWDAIRHGDHTGMLGVVGGEPQHFQPMTAFAEDKTNRIWFYTRKDTELAETVGAGASAMFIVMKDRMQACIGGRLSIQHDSAKIAEFWNPVVAAWYPEGKDDPNLTLLRLDCEDAQVWASQAGPVKFGWEIAKANATHTTPDVGQSTRLNLQ